MTEPTTPRRTKKGLVRSHPWWSLGVFVLLVIGSNIVDIVLDENRLYWGNLYADQQNARSVAVDTTDLAVSLNPLPYRVFVEGDEGSELPPVLLIHGSPGAAIGFEKLAPLLTDGGRRVIFYDLPGFASQAEPVSRGSVFEDYSSAAYAELTWRMLEAMGESERIHLVGWSNGGAVALRMIEDHPDRVASLTLLASVGAQETEGTGSYAFEHFKYKAGRALLVHGAKLIPHFGILGPASERDAFLRFFDDTDQRDLGPLMSAIETPTLILHGRSDFLVPARSAEKHRELMPAHSRLVMLDASHFIPLLEAEDASGHLNAHFARHDDPRTTVLNEDIILAPEPQRRGFDAFVHTTGERIYALPWPVVLLGVILLVRLCPHLGIILTMLFVVTIDIDFGVAIIGMLAGRVWWLLRGANILDRPWTVLGWVRGVFSIAPAFVIGLLFGVLIMMATREARMIGFLLATLAGWFVLRLLRLAVTFEGRGRIRAKFGRLINHEYWPSAVIYRPVIGSFARRCSLKPLAQLCAVNPGYAPDGGVNEDAKSTINNRFPDDPAVLPLHLVDRCDDHARRLGQAANAVRTNKALGGYPMIAKPDRGEHGIGVQLLRGEHDLDRYLRTHREPIVLQKYHAGPDEVGVLWIRDPDTIRNPDAPAPHGSIYAVTVKHFPFVTGDAKHSLRQLILRHPRYRCQALMFLDRLRADQHRIPGRGEVIQLGLAGNHKQGAKFTDGEHLATPALGARIDALARGFRDENGRGFDIGRFDLRCDSLEQLASGEGFGIVELNGLASEPTNLYDPEKTIFWAWRVLDGYWKHASSLADARIETGTGHPIPTNSVRKKLLGWLGRGLGLKARG